MFLRNLFIPLFLLFSQALIVLGALPAHAPRPPKQMRMEGSGSSSTYLATGTLEPHQAFSLATLEDLAEDFWWGTCNQPGARTTNGGCIVAVFGDPRTRQYSASTIPRGSSGTDSIRPAIEQESCNTPVWAEAYQNEIRSGRRNRGELHAEDVALAQWEINTDQEPIYNGHSLMGVYGDPGRHARDIARGRIEPCNRICKPLLRSLGVGFRGA